MIEVAWANTAKNIIRWKFPLQWTWNEFFSAKDEVDSMIDGVEGIVDSIFLIPEGIQLASGGIHNLKRILAERHERHDVIVLVGSTTFFTSLMRVILKLVPSARQQLQYVQNEAEAYAIIEAAQQKRRQNRVSQVAKDT